MKGGEGGKSGGPQKGNTKNYDRKKSPWKQGGGNGLKFFVILQE